MDAERLDRLVRAWSAGSRRRVLRGLAGALVAALPAPRGWLVAAQDGDCRRNGQACKRGARCCSGFCDGKGKCACTPAGKACADPAQCCSGLCEDGACACPPATARCGGRCCGAGERCKDGRCACVPEEKAATCAGKQCGHATNNCGQRVSCGRCRAAGEQCGNGRCFLAADSWVLAGTHPRATTQPTSQGRTLFALEAWRGELYAGYGDYDANTGPIAVSPFDPTTETFRTVHSSGTEAIHNYRSFGSKLYAPANDYRGADYAVGDASGAWTDRSVVVSSHAFDMASLTGADLWLVGSQGAHAAAWRSLDGGATWQRLLLHGDGIKNLRFYFAGVYGGKLYLQAKEVSGPADTFSKVFDGTAWSDGPNLLPSSGSGWRPLIFAGRMLYHTGPHFGGSLIEFDGTRSALVPHPDGGSSSFVIYNMTVDDGRLYVLGRPVGTFAPMIYATADLVAWTRVATTVPDKARSLAVLNGTFFVGTTDAKIYRGQTAG